MPRLPLSGETKSCLLQDGQLSHLQIIARPQLVEIDTARNPLTPFVATIPIRCLGFIRVIPRPLMTESQFMHQRVVDGVDGNLHIYQEMTLPLLAGRLRGPSLRALHFLFI